MPNNLKRTRCRSCGRMNCLVEPNEKPICTDCWNHREIHPYFDPRCVVCVAERIKALAKAAVIMIRLMLPPRVG